MKHGLFVLLIIGVFAGCNVQKKAEKYHHKGIAYLKKNDVQNAENAFLRSINEFPTKEAYYDLAQLYKTANKKCEYCKNIELASMYGYQDSIDLFFSDCVTKEEHVYENDSIINRQKVTVLYTNNCNNLKKRAYAIREKGEIITSFFIVNWKGKNNAKMLDTFPDINNRNIVYAIFDEAPQYVGGEFARMTFLQNNLVYPQISREENKKGIVKITFIIDENGNVTNLYVSYSVDENLDNEALRVVKLMPKWIPGKLNGVNVKAQFVLPIKFVLN